MKQKITEQQMSELSETERYTLFSWEKNNACASYMNGKFVFAPIDIGHMLQFLAEKKSRPDLYSGGILEMLKSDVQTNSEDTLCFCDALWEAVKKALKINW
jgi:hypothetical protein